MFLVSFLFRDSLARVHVHRFDARLALDVTAPVEFALAALLDGGLERVVAAPAAHQIAAVHAGRRPVARPPAGALKSNNNTVNRTMKKTRAIQIPNEPIVLFLMQ